MGNRGAPTGPLFCIDPGLQGTGWAYFPSASIGPKPAEFVPPANWGTIPATCAEFDKATYRGGQHMGAHYRPIWERADLMVDRLLAEFHSVNTESKAPYPLILLETPNVWGMHSRGAVSNNNGDLIKLSILVGVMAGRISEQRSDSTVHLTTPQEWKGQLGKDVVIRRLSAQLGTVFDNHAADAVGMGMAWQNAL